MLHYVLKVLQVCISYSPAVFAYCFLSVTFPPFTFVETRKSKCSRMSDRKLPAASAISLILSHGGVSPLSLYYCSMCIRKQRAKDDGPVISAVPTSFCSALLQLGAKNDIFCRENLLLQTFRCPSKTQILWLLSSRRL